MLRWSDLFEKIDRRRFGARTLAVVVSNQFENIVCLEIPLARKI